MDNLFTLEQLSHQVEYPIDIFICSASFEKRCLSIASHLNSDRINKVLIASNISFSEEIRKKQESLANLFSKNHELLLVDSDDPVMTADNIVEKLRKHCLPSPQHIVIDITTFTHEVLLVLFSIGRQIFKSTDTVEFLYATAGDYSVGDSPVETWLSKGLKEVRSIMGYPGEMIPSRKMHLIILGGHEEFRAFSLIQELEPSLISVGYGDKSEKGTEPHQETNETKVRRLQSLVGDVNEFVFSCYDPSKTEAKLNEIMTSFPNYNTIIAPMNTKISALGAAQFAFKNEQVQLCYSQPEIYNYENYSQPGKDCYCYTLDNYPFNKS